MAFQINLCYNVEALCKIKKNITTLTTVTGDLREETSIVDPVIIFEGNFEHLGFNYMYIPTFQRYYYVTNIKSIRTGLWEVSAHCDVLKTYADAILANTGVIARQENDWNMYINDGSFKVQSNPYIITKRFPNTFGPPSFVLALLGTNSTSAD